MVSSGCGGTDKLASLDGTDSGSTLVTTEVESVWGLFNWAVGTTCGMAGSEAVAAAFWA